MKIKILSLFLTLVLLINNPLWAATYIVQVKGMMCESCVKTVTDGFMKLDGVKDVNIDLINQIVTVDSDTPITPDAAKTIMTDRGYEFIEIKTENPISSHHDN